MTGRSRRTEIRIETHEITVVRFSDREGPVAREANRDEPEDRLLDEAGKFWDTKKNAVCAVTAAAESETDGASKDESS